MWAIIFGLCAVVSYPTLPPQYECTMPCRKVRRGCSAEQEHLCSKRCCDPCDECIVPVKKTLVPCGHVGMVPCSQPPAQSLCSAPCHLTLDLCGHPCRRRCGEECGGCKVQVVNVHSEMRWISDISRPILIDPANGSLQN